MRPSTALQTHREAIRLVSLSMLTSVMCAKAPGMAVSFCIIAYRSAERGY